MPLSPAWRHCGGKTTFLSCSLCCMLAVMGVIAFLVYFLLVNKAEFLVTTRSDSDQYSCGRVVYGVLIVLTRAVTAEELAGYAVWHADSAAVPEISFNVKDISAPEV